MATAFGDEFGTELAGNLDASLKRVRVVKKFKRDASGDKVVTNRQKRHAPPNEAPQQYGHAPQPYGHAPQQHGHAPQQYGHSRNGQMTMSLAEASGRALQQLRSSSFPSGSGYSASRIQSIVGTQCQIWESRFNEKLDEKISGLEEKVVTLLEQREQQGAQEPGGQKEPESPTAEKERATLEGDVFEDSADAADLTNMYSFSLVKLESILSLPTLSPNHFLRIVLLCLAPLMLTAIQLFFAYGFYDASIVLKVQQTLASFRDPLPFSFWYAESIVPGTQMVLLNAILSICAFALLAIYLKNDNEGTMVTVCPLELLCLPRAGGGAPQVFHRGPLSACWRIVVVIIGMVCWSIRSLLVPVLAGYGTVGAMLNSSNGQDIVLNSVAIGFVLELDEFLYDNVLGKKTREDYQVMILPATNTLSIRGGSKCATFYGYAIYILDITLLLYAYFEEIYEVTGLNLQTMVEVDLKRRYFRFRVHLMLRAALLAATHGHLAMLGADARQWRRSRLVWPVLLFMIMIVGFAAMMYTLVLAGLLDTQLGCDFQLIMLSPRTMTCCVQQDFFVQASATLGFSTETCEKLDEVEGIFDLVAKEARYNNNDQYGNTLDLAWGVNHPPEGYFFSQTIGNFARILGVGGG